MTPSFNYWSLVLDTLRTKISASHFQSWFNTLGFDSLTAEGRKIILTAPSEFHKSFVTKKYSKDLQEAIQKYYPKVIHVDFKVVEPEQRKVQEFIELADKPQEKIPEAVEAYLPSKNISSLNQKYTFENFVITRNVEFAYNVSKGIVKEPGSLYNPLFLHSPVGLGKTHLVQSIGHAFTEEFPSKNIKYVPAETLFNQFYFALNKKEVDKFREFYQDVDLLLVDDIQFISGKEVFQEVFFHLFNTLHQANKQIVFTSDRAPQELVGITERLVSRFGSGLVVDLPRPDVEDRVSILRYKAEKLQLALSDEILRQIAGRVTSNVRELEGALNKIRAILTQDPGRTIEVEDIARLFRQDPTYDFQVQLSPEAINLAVCKVLSVQPEELLGTSREKNIALARQLSFYLYKTELDLSFPLIGKLFGGKDHSTVMHGVKKIQKLLDQNDIQITQKLNLAKDLLSKIH